MNKPSTILILGITGGVGGAAAEAFLKRGWQVVALTRKPLGERGERFSNRITWVEGDAMNRVNVAQAARGCDFILHAVNPPNYQRWSELVLPMLGNTIFAASITGAHILVPGNIYNFGPDAFPLLTESSPQHPTTRKGAVRVTMERQLKVAARAGMRVTILRTGDFFGAHTASDWFSQGMVRPGRPLKSLWYPGAPDVGHSWAYLPDVGETFARLAELPPTKDTFEVYHFRGHWMPRGIAIAESTCKVAGLPLSRIGRFPWRAVKLTSPIVPMFREMREMEYLWHESIELDNAKLLRTLGAEPHTPLDVAVQRTLESLGCLLPALPDTAPHAA